MCNWTLEMCDGCNEVGEKTTHDVCRLMCEGFGEKTTEPISD
jgi:hypothetical protein